MPVIVEMIDTVLSNPENPEVIAEVRARVNALMADFDFCLIFMNFVGYLSSPWVYWTFDEHIRALDNYGDRGGDRRKPQSAQIAGMGDSAVAPCRRSGWFFICSFGRSA